MPSDPGEAGRRGSWPVRRYPLGEEPSQSLSDTTTAQERVEMLWPLALEAWALTGRPLPAYARSEAPVRCVPLGAAPKG